MAKASKVNKAPKLIQAPPLVPNDRGMIDVTEVAKIRGEGIGYDRVFAVAGTTYKDCSTVIIIPSRDKYIHHKVFLSWENMITPMNQKRAKFVVVGDEVGAAYTNTIKQILANPELSTWKYVMTLETDNLIPQDAHIRLLETIESGKYDGVSGIYFTKGEYNMPMAYGDPDEYRRTGKLDFKPRNITDALARGHVMPVNGIAMGCSLYRMELFKTTPEPWFQTVSDVVNGAPQAFTQDLWACKKWVEMGKTFAVDMRVRVGHMDLATDQVY